MASGTKSRVRGAWAITALALVAGGALTVAQSLAPAPATGVRFAQIGEADARTWLTYLSSDLLQGRRVFTEGYGMAASYIAAEARELGLKPLGDNGSYFQVVKQNRYQVSRSASVTVEVNGTSRTFKHGDHVIFSLDSGGKQTLTFGQVEFAGYGIVAIPGSSTPSDFSGRDVRGKLVVYLPGTPAAVAAAPSGGRRPGGAVSGNRSGPILDLGAAAVIRSGPVAASPVASTPAPAGRGGRSGGAANTLTTTRRVEDPVAPSIVADDTFLEFLFSTAPAKFADLKAASDKGDPLTPFTLSNVKVTFDIDNTFEITSTQITENVVAMVEGTDATLKDTYVLFGAHLDHVGYLVGNDQPPGRVRNPIDQDQIWNGADDDGSGSTALLAIAKAFVTGPKPRRSIIFVWHAGEESGLIGSTYMADHPVVPLEKVQVELNIDMIGRNRDDNPAQIDTLYVIGADRISTDLHNLLVSLNSSLAAPLTLDFEFNDPTDPNSFYTRSDHYSYASKGIPIAFFFTGEHPDYHANSDTVDKIIFPKLVRIAQYVYQAGFSIANTDRVLVRDNAGPRAGRGFTGPLPR